MKTCCLFDLHLLCVLTEHAFLHKADSPVATWDRSQWGSAKQASSAASLLRPLLTT